MSRESQERAPEATWSVTLLGAAANNKEILAKHAAMFGVVKHPRWYGAREEAVRLLGCSREEVELKEQE